MSNQNQQQPNNVPEHALAVRKAGLPVFKDFLQHRIGTLNTIAASMIRPERLMKIALSCVTTTPALQECTMGSIFTSIMQSAELGLEPGSAIGEAYLVPFKARCQLIVGYRGLISLAFRSGYIKSIQAREVYGDDTFDYENGLEPKLKHVPSGAEHKADEVTHAYCVVQLKDGGVVYDVMTRQEIDRIRGKSAASAAGPWVTDYVEMAKKTVTRRCLKYAPMSIEMSKALALDNAADTNDLSKLEFDMIDAEFEEQPAEVAKRGTEAVKAKLNGGAEKPDAQASPPAADETTNLRAAVIKEVMAAKKDQWLPFVAFALGETKIEDASHDQLLALRAALNDKQGEQEPLPTE